MILGLAKFLKYDMKSIDIKEKNQILDFIKIKVSYVSKDIYEK